MASTPMLANCGCSSSTVPPYHTNKRPRDIEKHITNPPRSLTTALGRDIEIYDQLCDSIEAQLVSLDSYLLL